MMKEELTTNSYWSNQYKKNISLPIVEDISTVGAADLDAIFRRFLPSESSLSFLELGCSPGRWMHYFNKYFHYKVSGVEYTNEGVALTRKNLEILNIEGEVFEKDVIDFRSDTKYDVVFSAGLIEHFSGEKLNKIVQKHFELCSKEGYVIFFIPNLTGFNRVWQKLVSGKVLDLHNTEIMHLSFFQTFPSIFGGNIQPLFIGYTGRMSFNLFYGTPFLLKIGYALQYVLDFIFLKVKIDIPNKAYIAPYIVAIYRNT